ncbi:MAG: tetratricopeptide repeat protein, partial [Myxococcota bacterium]|nr:tetratricopeptide repeat protein [Myxococcota bacterium]
WAWHGRGDALQLLGQHVDALDAYTRAARLAPDTGLHHAGRANALKSLDRGQEAHQAQVRAQTCDPTLEWMAPTE